jgi:hypothetical protein
MGKRDTKGSDGKYTINGKKFDQLIGSRAMVWHGTAYKTSSGAVKPRGDALTKSNLKMNKHGRIVSAAKSAKGPMMLKRLHNKGYFTRKGHFGAVKKSSKGKGTNKRKHKSRGKKKKSGTKKKYKRVTIHEKRSRASGRFSKGGK